MTRILKIAGIVLASLGIILYTLPALFKGKVERSIRESLPAFLEAEVDFTNFNFSLLKSFPYVYLEADRLSILGQSSFEGDTLLYAPQASAAWNFWSYLKDGTLRFDYLNFHDSYLQIILQEDGKVNYDIVQEDTTIIRDSLCVKEPWTFIIDEYKVGNGRLDYRDIGWQMDLQAWVPHHEGKLFMTEKDYRIETFTDARDFYMNWEGRNYVNHIPLKGDLTIYIQEDRPTEMILESENFSFNRDVYVLSGQIRYEFEEAYTYTDLDYKVSYANIPEFRIKFPRVYENIFGDDEKMAGFLSLSGSSKGYYDLERSPNIMVDAELRSWRPPMFAALTGNIDVDIKVNSPENRMDAMDIYLVRPKNGKKFNVMRVKRSFDGMKNRWSKPRQSHRKPTQVASRSRSSSSSGSKASWHTVKYGLKNKD